VMGVYPTKDGRWSYLHCNFPNHRAAALSVLGVAEDRDAVAKAVAKWNAQDLEDAIIEAKGAGGMVRAMEEWAKHPQAAAIANLPLMEIVKIADSPPEPLPEGSRPLSGVRVLDLTRVLAGPTCARTLAEHGADVMKITAAHLPNIGYQEYDTGHGKLNAQLDLREDKNLETLRDLVQQTDVFSQGYRPGTLGGRGLSPEELAELRPGIVYISLCAFSHVGPWASRRGFDTVVQTVSGITSRQGDLFPGVTPGPQFYPVSAIDYRTGETAWRHAWPIGGGGGAGVLTTAGGLVFTGDGSGNFVAFDAADGDLLWHTRIGNISNAPQTYLIDGRQHVLVASDRQLYAFVMY